MESCNFEALVSFKISDKAKYPERVVRNHKYSTAKVNTFLRDKANFKYPQRDMRKCHCPGRVVGSYSLCKRRIVL